MTTDKSVLVTPHNTPATYGKALTHIISRKADKIRLMHAQGQTFRQISIRLGIHDKVGQATNQCVLDFIIGYKSRHDGNSPSTRQIAAGLGGMSTNTVKKRLESLVALGRIRFPEGMAGAARCIEVVGGEWKYEEPAHA